MFWEAEDEVGGVLARANMRIITSITAYPSHQIRSGVERPNGLSYPLVGRTISSRFDGNGLSVVYPFLPRRIPPVRCTLCWAAFMLDKQIVSLPLHFLDLHLTVLRIQNSK